MEGTQYKIISAVVLTILLGACFYSNNEQKQALVISYDNIPAPPHNLMDEDKIALGKRLFHDANLSKDSTVACITCHLPQYGFGENVALSISGVSHQPLKRNSPALINVAWAKGWFWDGGAKNLESLIFGPLTHEDEMGVNLKELMIKINNDPSYKSAFSNAFKIEKVYSSHVARALAQYVRTLISNQSNYDLYLVGQYEFSDKELKGYSIFKENCSSCHQEPFFTDFKYHNNGLDSIYFEDDEGITKGRGRISRVAKDNGKFKTPTLRNIFATAPYMHDGRFETIDDVFDHYQFNIIKNNTLDSIFTESSITLNSTERNELKAFLYTLTDSIFLKKNETL